MSAQRRSSASNRRTRGAGGRKAAGTTTVDPTVEASSNSAQAVAVAEPPVKTPPPSGRPRMATDRKGAQGPSRGGERVAGVRRYLNDTRAELRRVTWPDQITLRNLTLVVIAVSAVMGLLLGGIDFVLLKIFEAF